MSDFLTRLAARALAQPTLHPRTRMRFEPEVAEEPAPVWPERSAVTPAAEREPERAAASEPPHAASEPLKPQPPRVITRDVVRTEQRVHVEPHIETRIERRVLHRVDPRVRTQERIVRERELVHTETETTKLVPHRHDEQPPVVSGAAGFSLPPRANTTLARPKPAAPHGRTPSIVMPAPAPAPDVHVSIGRVEIRATTPPAPRKSSPRSGTMTLDDYVAKRNRERR